MNSISALRTVSVPSQSVTTSVPRRGMEALELPFSSPSVMVSSVTSFGSTRNSSLGLSDFLGSNSGLSGVLMAQFEPGSNSSLDRLRQEERQDRTERAERSRRQADSRAAAAYHRSGDSSGEYERARNEAFQRRSEEFRAQDDPF